MTDLPAARRGTARRTPARSRPRPRFGGPSTPHRGSRISDLGLGASRTRRESLREGLGWQQPVAVPDRAKEATTQFLKTQFHRYYDGSKPTLPDRFGRREFGFMFWTAGIVQRHLGFSREEELRSFLSSRVPAHAYYSSAYYETPNAPTMEEKGWLGADLIFDLDADHLPGAQSMTYPEMLEAIRLKIVKLYDEFLVEDFGVDVSNMRIVFSGGRGYHIHVRDPRVLTLGSHERREIVDWIFGTAFDTRSAFKETVYDTKQ